MNITPPPIIPPPRDTEEKTPFWSVMIPTYNPRRDLLEIALKSVLAQDPGPAEMEIVVVDDGSPNGSPERWVHEIAGDRVTFLGQTRNRGIAGIWNHCVTLSRGKWVHIFHQDDVVGSRFYSTLRSGVEKAPNVGAAFCRWSFIDGDGSTLKTVDPERDSSGILEDFLTALPAGVRVSCASIIVKRSVYEEIGGFREDLTHALDWEMWIRIATRHNFHYEPELLANWRHHKTATTARQMLTGENVRDTVKAIEVWRSYVPSNLRREMESRARRFWANEAIMLARIFLDGGNFRAFRAQLHGALVCDPSTATLADALRLSGRAAIKLARRAARKAGI